MTHQGTEYVQGRRFLQPNHLGIVAWQYKGDEGWLDRYFPIGSVHDSARFFSASEERTAATLENVRSILGRTVVCVKTNIYNDVLGSLFKEQHGDGGTGPWTAVVLERTGHHTPSTLARLQQLACDSTHQDTTVTQQEIASAKETGKIPSEVPAEEITHTTTHLHTVNPRLVVPQQAHIPVHGLWLPNTIAHH